MLNANVLCLLLALCFSLSVAELPSGCFLPTLLNSWTLPAPRSSCHNWQDGWLLWSRDQAYGTFSCPDYYNNINNTLPCTSNILVGSDSIRRNMPVHWDLQQTSNETYTLAASGQVEYYALGPCHKICDLRYHHMFKFRCRGVKDNFHSCLRSATIGKKDLNKYCDIKTNRCTFPAKFWTCHNRCEWAKVLAFCGEYVSTVKQADCIKKSFIDFDGKDRVPALECEMEKAMSKECNCDANCNGAFLATLSLPISIAAVAMAAFASSA